MGQRQSADEKITQKIYPDPGKFTQKKVGKTAQAIIDAIVADSKITRKGLASLLGISENAIKHHLSALQAREIILHIGPDNGGYWKLLIKK